MRWGRFVGCVSECERDSSGGEDFYKGHCAQEGILAATVMIAASKSKQNLILQ